MSVDNCLVQSNREIFLAALEVPDSELRRAFVQRACGGNVERLREVERLLVLANDGGDGPLDQAAEELGLAATQAVGSDALIDFDISNHPIIDRYKLLQQIGEGGMGTVFMAQQTEPVKRMVALKLIKAGMDSREVITRFEAERQALAMMDHPNIARVLDAGTTAEGRPYFVMELVRGQSITDYCDQAALSIDDRLRLFMDVCHAVQHAHQKGIIHRDLKPSNVLVTLHDGEPVVKVIDFGVAKALNQELTERTLFTHFAQMIGTPLYMSPEQAELSGLNIDTRSDVYSLGVLLYELLTGTTPFDKATLSKAGFDGMRRIIREQEPPRPSYRISTLEARLLSTVSNHRQADPRRLSLSLRSELDWIVMRALEKDRNRRYESASALAQDIQRHLDDEPVLACPPTLLYRMLKTGRRNGALIGTAVLVAISLVIGLAGTAWQAVAATQESQRAVAAENQAKINAERATAAEKEAQAQNAKSERNLEAALVAMEKLLTHVGNPDLAEIPQLQGAFEKILDDSLAFYDQFAQEHGTSPDLQYRAVAVLERLAMLAKDSGKHPKAAEAYAKAIVRVDRLIAQSPDRVEHREQQAEIYRRSGRFHMDLNVVPNAVDIALRHLQHAESLFRNLSLSEPGNKHYQAVEADAIRAQARVHQKIDPTDPRIATLVTRAYELAERSIPDSGIVKAMAEVLSSSDPDRADDLYRRAIVVQRGVQNPTRSDRFMLAWICTEVANSFNARHPTEAEECWHEAIDILTPLCREFPSLNNNPWLLFKTASNYTSFLVNHHRTNDALQLYHDLAVKLADDYKIHASRSEFLVSVVTSEEAILALTTAIEEFPRQSAYYRYRGAVHVTRHEFELALTDLNRAVQLRKADDIDPYLSRGEGFHRMKEYAKAIDDFDAFLEKSPKGHVYKRRAASHFQLLNYEAATADLKQSVALKSDDLSNLTWIPLEEIAACPDEEFRDEFLKLVNEVVKLNGNSRNARATRATILCAFGQQENALLDLEGIVESGNASAKTHYQTALLHLASGELEVYRNDCKRILKSFAQSDDPITEFFAAWSCALTTDAIEDYRPAIELARKSVAKDSKDQQYRVGLGAILLRSGQAHEAKVELQQALAVVGNDNTSPAYTQYFLALTEHTLGNSDASKEHLRLANEASTQELSSPVAWNRKLTLELLRSEAESLVSVIDPPGQADATGDDASEPSP